MIIIGKRFRCESTVEWPLTFLRLFLRLRNCMSCPSVLSSLPCFRGNLSTSAYQVRWKVTRWPSGSQSQSLAFIVHSALAEWRLPKKKYPLLSSSSTLHFELWREIRSRRGKSSFRLLCNRNGSRSSRTRPRRARRPDKLQPAHPLLLHVLACAPGQLRFMFVIQINEY